MAGATEIFRNQTAPTGVSGLSRDSSENTLRISRNNVTKTLRNNLHGAFFCGALGGWADALGDEQKTGTFCEEAGIQPRCMDSVAYRMLIVPDGQARQTDTRAYRCFFPAPFRPQDGYALASAR